MTTRQPRTFHVDVHRIDEGTTFYENMGPYASIKLNCFFDHKNRPEMHEYMRECSQFLTENPSSEYASRARDPEAILDLGIRYLSGCGVRKPSIQGALYMFDMLTDEFASGDAYIGDMAPANIRAMAHSGAAAAYWRDWCTTDEAERAEIHAETHRFGRPLNPNGESPYAPLVFAATHATHSICLGLVSASVLYVGLGIKNVLDQIGSDLVDSYGEEVRWADEFIPLWQVLKKREEEILAEERRRQAKIRKDAKAYICAAEGCKVGAVHKAALLACGGKCPSDLKPHYCSKECQKRDWPKHKQICKLGSQGKARIISDKQQTERFLNDFLRTPGLGVDTRHDTGRELGGEWIEGPTQIGPQHTIEVPGLQPGERIKLVSSTLRPTELRALREGITNVETEGIQS